MRVSFNIFLIQFYFCIFFFYTKNFSLWLRRNCFLHFKTICNEIVSI
ncbi:hypothetical protein PUN28_000339 [Cardiocondyla obscurior]|uniref:Uncharacterized protein n=1 Tax=Cardiocondyla obscurior TaxID=286306 RepID=A0AAW2GZB3_9HYME